MKKRNKVFSLILAAVMIFSVGCTTDGPNEDGGNKSASGQTDNAGTSDSKEKKAGDSKGLKVGIAAREITNDYNRSIISGAQQTIEAAGGTVVVTDAQADVQKHNENIENLLNSDIDSLIVHLGDPEQLAPLMKQAKEKGIQVITAGVGAPVSNTLGDVNGDDPLMATLAADALLSSIDYKGDVYIVWVPGAPLLETRKRIFEAIAADYPDVKLHEVPAEHNPAKVQTQIEEILTANPDKESIAGIFGTYDQLVSGASEAIRRAGRGGDISMVGIDGDILGFQMLFQEDSPFVASVVMDTDNIGKQSAEIIMGVIDGTVNPEDLSRKIPASCYVATRKNGVKAAEMKWTENFWEDAGLSKEDIEKKFPAEDEVVVTYPTMP